MQSPGDATTAAEAPPPLLTVRGAPVYFAEDWTAGIGGGLWSTGRLMARFLASEPGRGRVVAMATMVRQRGGAGPLSVLELGSGNGLLSVCLVAALAEDGCLGDVVVTDRGDHLALIRKTMAANPHIMDAPASPAVHVLEHDWGRFHPADDRDDLVAQVQQGRHTFDLIVASDVAYHRSLYDPLIRSLEVYFHEDTLAIIGVTMLDTTVEFFDKLRQTGFSYERVVDALVDSEFRGMTFGLFLIRRNKPRRVIQYNRNRE